LSGQKLFLDFKNPFKILAEAEPRLWRGEATIAQNPNFENWRYLLDKIRTFFDENPKCYLFLQSPRQIFLAEVEGFSSQQYKLRLTTR
jgi:hypothetical protein